MRNLVAVAFATGVASSAVAGQPTEVPFTCPVGGEQFTITETLSCSTMGATMSLRSVTSCDFVTRLPVCPSNGFPAYREFNEDEAKKLEAFVTSDHYAELLELSPFQRAYGVAEFLGEARSEQAYWLQMSSVWFEPELFFEDPASVEKFLIEADGQRSRVSDEDRPYFLASVSYVLAKSGRGTAARQWFSEAAAASDGSDFLKAYLKALEGCLTKIESAECQPEAELDF